MRVSVFGPNLRDQSKGQVHVHSADCGDICKMRRREPEYSYPLTVEASSELEIVELIYDPGDFEWDPNDSDDYRMYRSEFYFFPCTKGLEY